MFQRDKKIVLVTTTRNSYEDFQREPIQTLMESNKGKIHHTFPFLNNSKGLPEIYNQFLGEEHRDKIVIFAHSDVEITDSFFVDKIVERMERGYAVVGCAGITKIYHQRKESLWHWMNNVVGDKGYSGAVAHPSGSGFSVTAFGPYPKSVVLLDGLLLAVNVEEAHKKGFRFDERFRFHHYDLDFSLSAHFSGASLTTVDSVVKHMSPGLRSLSDPAWVASNEAFNQKWNFLISNKNIIANEPN